MHVSSEELWEPQIQERAHPKGSAEHACLHTTHVVTRQHTLPQRISIPSNHNIARKDPSVSV